MELYDVAIIGAGVLGCALARELSRYRLDVVVLERAHDVGEGSSKANSGIVHAGFHPRGGSLKGRSCVEGNAAFSALARELDVPFIRCGAMMVTTSPEGTQKLRDKVENGIKNGIGKLDIIDGDKARELEPRLSDGVTHALLAPSTGIISPFELVLALAQNAQSNGVEFRFNSAVERIESTGVLSKGRYTLHLEGGMSVQARFVANMAGDDASKIDSQVRPADYEVRPRLGEYIVLDKQSPENAITHVLYQTGEGNAGGTLIAPTVDGNLLLGPTSVNVSNYRKVGTTEQGLHHIKRVASSIIPDLDFSRAIRNFAGVRTNIVNVPKELKDFVVRASAPGFVSALGIKNPGLTCSPILAKRALNLLADEGLKLEPDVNFNPCRKRYVPYLQRSRTEQAKLLKRDSSYGRVVCRCEGITEGDIRAVMAQPLPPTTMAGVKRRFRCGMGRCQGQFCEPRVVRTMADALGVRPERVPYGEMGGRFVIRVVK